MLQDDAASNSAETESQHHLTCVLQLNLAPSRSHQELWSVSPMLQATYYYEAYFYRGYTAAMMRTERDRKILEKAFPTNNKPDMIRIWSARLPPLQRLLRKRSCDLIRQLRYRLYNPQKNCYKVLGRQNVKKKTDVKAPLSN